MDLVLAILFIVELIFFEMFNRNILYNIMIVFIIIVVVILLY